MLNIRLSVHKFHLQNHKKDFSWTSYIIRVTTMKLKLTINKKHQTQSQVHGYYTEQGVAK